MKSKSSCHPPQGITLLELLVILAIIAIGIAILSPAISGRRTPSRIVPCMNNQRQILIGEHIWSADNNGSWRWLRFAENSSNLVATENLAANYFQPLHRDYVKNAAVFVCPMDKNRKAASNGLLSSTNVGYFVSFTAGATNPSLSALTGDRHLTVDSQPLSAGLQSVAANQVVRYTSEFHPNMAGVLGFMDGHVELKRSTNVSSIFQNQNVATNLLAIP